MVEMRCPYCADGYVQVAEDTCDGTCNTCQQYVTYDEDQVEAALDGEDYGL